MLCEICGAETAKTFKVIFEGDIVLACANCLKRYGLRKAYSKPVIGSKAIIRGAKKLFEDLVLVEGYGFIVRKSREKRGLSQEKLAKLVGEKVSVIKKIEAERLIPSDELVRKLQNALKVKLVEEDD